jgi:hypothetical protein
VLSNRIFESLFVSGSGISAVSRPASRFGTKTARSNFSNRILGRCLFPFSRASQRVPSLTHYSVGDGSAATFSGMAANSRQLR